MIHSNQRRYLKVKRGSKTETRKFIHGRKNKWLMDLLKIIGRSQQQLGAMVGVSRNVIANIASGRSPLLPKLAQKIYVATGASHLWYFRGDDRVLSVAEKPYTKAAFDHWRTEYSFADQKSRQAFFRNASDTLLVLLEAAERCKRKNHLPGLRQSFWDWCVESYTSFQLEKPVAEVLESRKFIDEREMRYGDWRRPKMAGIAAFYGFRDNARKSDDDLLKLKVEAWPGWCPCGNMKGRSSNAVNQKCRKL